MADDEIRELRRCLESLIEQSAMRLRVIEDGQYAMALHVFPPSDRKAL